MLATLIRWTGDIDLAEDAVQDAILIALERWPRDGAPSNPAAWLTTAARRRALDRLRREANRTTKERAAVHLLDDDENWRQPARVGHDQLRLLFTCCHPALAPDVQVALTLRTLCGLTTYEIARAFLVAEPTMGQRISRAKRKIAMARIPYRVPEDHELPDRLPAVLATIYVVFTIGHHAVSGQLDARVALADEGVRLARLAVALMPDEPECAGLLALSLATHARRAARVDAAGDLVLLADQDRRLWDHDAIGEAAELVEATLRRRRPGPYQLQAAIAVLHGLAPSIHGDRLATDRRAVPGARVASADGGGARQPCGGGGRSARAREPGSNCSTSWRPPRAWPERTRSTGGISTGRPAPTCRADSGG